MKEEKVTVKTSSGKENEPVTENTSKKKTKEEKPPTKVVVRRLPPSMTEEQFKMQVSPLPDFDYFYFVPTDLSLMPNAFSRAYINFIDQNDLFIFTQKFDGYVFVDSKGGEFPAVVEFAPFQRIPKNRPNRKKDSKVGTIECDPIYIAFKERMEAENLENKTAVNTSKQHFFETSLSDKKEEVSNTPLLDYIRNKRAERQRVREEKREEKRKKDLERRRAKEEQRRVKKDDETSVVKNPPSSPVNPNPKPKEALLEITENKENPPSNKFQHENKTSENVTPKHVIESSKTSKEEQITNKVRELVNFFSKSVNESGDEPIKIGNADLSNCIKHEDLEREMMNSLGGQREMISKQFPHGTHVSSPKKFTKINLPISYNSSAATSRYPPIPVGESRAGMQMYVPRNPRKVMYTRSNSDIVMRPVRVNLRERKESGFDVQNFVKECEIIRPTRPIRVNIPVIQGNRRTCETLQQTVRKPYDLRPPIRVNIPVSQDVRSEIDKNVCQKDKQATTNYGENEKNIPTKNLSIFEKEHKLPIKSGFQEDCKKGNNNFEEKKKSEVEPVSSSEVLKKNLQKVIANVLGNTKVCNPKENVINKPKTFVRRGCSGSGDECRGKGFNSPNFYLPPRAFGCGLGEVSESKDSKNVCRRGNNHDISPKYPASFTEHSHYIPKVSMKKFLPPFSKKSASSSKSDGDIEKPETVGKVGGSEESLKRMPPQAFIVQRPYAAPRKPMIVEKNG